MSLTIRFLAGLVASCCALLAFASLGSAQEKLYGADGAQGNPSNLYVLDPASGAVLQTLGPIGFAVTGLAIDPSTRTLYGSTANRDATAPGHLITIDKSTGAGTLVGELVPGPDGETAADLTFTPDATLYGWLEAGTDDLVTIDKTSGAATVVGESSTSTAGAGLASNAVGVLYLAGEGDDGPLYTVDRASGAVTTVATLSGLPASDEIGALAFDAAGTLFGAGIDTNVTPRATELIAIDTGSGAINVRGPSVNQLDAIVFDSPPPAPAATCKGQSATLKGTDGPDQIYGTTGADVIATLGGDDQVFGLAGDDLICGGEGGDRLKAGPGNDRLIGQNGKDKLNGKKGNDTLSGKNGADRVIGGEGNDKLKGGRGKDTCKPGKGNNTTSSCEIEK